MSHNGSSNNYYDSDSDESAETVVRVSKPNVGEQAKVQPKKKTANGNVKAAEKFGQKMQPGQELSDSEEERSMPTSSGLALHNISAGEEDAHQGPPSPPSEKFSKLSVKDDANPAKNNVKSSLYMQEKLAKKKPANPTMDVMLHNAIEAKDDRGQGASIFAIKKYIESTYEGVNLSQLNDRLKKALKKGLDSGELKRPNSTSQERMYDLTGRVKLANNNEPIPPKTKKAPSTATVTRPPKDTSPEPEDEQEPLDVPKKTAAKPSGARSKTPVPRKNVPKATAQVKKLKKSQKTETEDEPSDKSDEDEGTDEEPAVVKKGTAVTKSKKPNQKTMQKDSDGAESRNDLATSGRSRKDLTASTRSKKDPAASTRSRKNSATDSESVKTAKASGASSRIPKRSASRTAQK